MPMINVVFLLLVFLLVAARLAPPAADAQIAAVAMARGLVLVTRNVRDFVPFDLEVLKPWDAGDGSPPIPDCRHAAAKKATANVRGLFFL